MYAIIELGGRQWTVKPGTQLLINRLTGETGAQHTINRVLLAQDGQKTQIGKPYLENAKVICEVLSHEQGSKVITYRYRRRENWRKTVGHRQPITRLLVKEIHVGNASATIEPPTRTAAPTKPEKPKAAVPKTSHASALTKKTPAARSVKTKTKSPSKSK
ncbi:MAG: 50S ribosomal protein L21 [Candidatus Omnitrophica bacterium]|nr:50S ribosomal protein L21 [Candidatus Omnitrophota bacterium]MBI2174015.1 50S ribosomal protein L21 [Candidatus Omnitrophota bacterium]MBI3010021.1 50S ribosomal protein L21 [Candidatus Omnitrophota bacterium]